LIVFRALPLLLVLCLPLLALLFEAIYIFLEGGDFSIFFVYLDLPEHFGFLQLRDSNLIEAIFFFKLVIEVNPEGV
jgi:hypothetical protein